MLDTHKTTRSGHAAKTGGYTGRILFAIILGVSALVPVALLAPPVPVPNLTTPGFQSSDLDPYFRAAASEQSESQWLASVNDGLTIVTADWETQVDQEIEDLVQDAKNTYPAMTAQEEQDLRDALVAQKQAARTSWEASADLEVERQQEDYIQELVGEQLRDLPATLQSADASGLDSYLQRAATDAYTLTDWEQIVDEGSFQLSSAWEAIAIPALQQAASDQTDQAVTDGTIVSTEAQSLYEAELLSLLTDDAVEIFRAALASRIQPELRTFIDALGRDVNATIALPAFDSAEIAPYIAAAQTSADEDQWRAAVESGRDYARDAWMVNATYGKNTIITAMVGDSGLTGNDATVYGNFLATELDAQIALDQAAWLADANAHIATELANYQANVGSLDLTTPPFDVDLYGLIYEPASFAPSEAAWEATVQAGRDDARNAWQVSVADRIDTIIADADANGMPPGQQNQLRSDLEDARDLALVDWDAAADAADASQHEAFLLTLLSTQGTPPLPALAAFDTAALDVHITNANNTTNSPSVWQSMVEDGIQTMFDAWKPGADPLIAQAATDAVSLAVANGLIHSTRAQELAGNILRQGMETDAYDAYVNAGLAYMSDSFVSTVDDVFAGIPQPALDPLVMDFNPNDMSPVFTSALTAANLYDWALLIDDGKATQRQAYFTAVSNHLDQVIDDAVAASGLNPADGSVYRRYLQYSLANEAQLALQDWDSDADGLILQRRTQFLQSLTPTVTTVNESGAPAINIQPLTTQAFSDAPLLALFEQAKNAANTAQWDGVVLNQTQILAAAWNTQTSATIDNLVTQYTAGVTDDTFETITVDGVQAGQGVKVNSLLAYQDYVRNFLEDQKRLQFAAWVKQAEQTIAQGREAFLAELSAAAVATQQEENAAAGELTGEQTDNVADEADRVGDQQIAGEPKTQEQEARDYLTKVRRQLQLEEMSWRSDWRDRRDTGLNQYNKALALLDQNRDAYMSTMQQADLTWQTNLAMMEQFEGNVRGGLTTVTAQLQQMIAMNPMFHTDASCADNRKSNCVLSPSSGQNIALNGAGQALKARIDTLEARLAAGDPLSTVVGEIQQALEGMKTHAESRKVYWSERIEGDDRWAQSFQWGEYQAPGSKGKYGGGNAALDEVRQRGAIFESGGVSAGALDTKIVYRWTTYTNINTGYFGNTVVPQQHSKVIGDLKDDPATWDLTNQNGQPISVDMAALLQHRKMALAIDNVRTDDKAGMADFITDETAEQRIVVAGTPSGDLCGSGTTASSSSESYLNECYSQVGDRAFVYYGQGGKHGGYTGWAPVRQVDLNLNYKWYDVNAEANWRVWDEALASVEAVTNHWTNEVLPDVQAWEQQVADYKAAYAQWQIDSGVQMQEYHQAYLAGRDQLLMGRNKFLYEMGEEWRDGRAQYEQAYDTVDRIEVSWVKQVAEVRAAGEEDVEEDMVDDLKAQLDAVVDAIDIEQTALPDVAGELEAVLDTLPELEEDFLLQFQQGVPDPNLIAGVAQDFQETATGMINFAILHATGDRLEEARQQYIDRMKELLESIEPPEQGELPEAPFTKYDVVVNDDGSITGVRTIYDGTAKEIDKGKGGYALKPENYAPNMTVQEIHLQAPEAGALPDIGDIFQTGIGEMMEGVNSALIGQGEALGDSSRFAVVESQISDQMEIASKNVEQFFQDRQAHIAWEQNAKESDSGPMKIISTVLAVASTAFGCVPCGVALLAVNAYQGYQEGGLLGAITGMASSYISGFTAAVGVSVNLNYTYEDGFGGSIGLGVPGGGLGVTAGVGADAGTFGVGYTGGGKGGLAGLDLGLNYSKDGGFGVSAGYSKDGFGGSLSYSQENGFGAGLSYTNGNLSAGLDYSQNGGFSADLGLSYGGIGKEQSDWLRTSGQLGLSLSEDGVGLTNTTSVSFESGGFHGWNGQASGGSALGVQGTTTNGLFFGADGEVTDIYGSSVNYSSEALKSLASDQRDGLLGLDFEKDEFGNRVKRLTTYLDGGSTDESQKYALCPGEATEVCERQADGTYKHTGMTPTMLAYELQQQYGNNFVLEHQGMNTDVNSTAHAGGRISGAEFHEGALTLGIENTSGFNLLNVGSHLNGSDSDGQGGALADLLQGLYSVGGVDAIHRMYAHSDGTSITATADHILHDRAAADEENLSQLRGLLSDTNTVLYGSPLDNTAFNLFVGNSAEHWSDLSVRRAIGGDIVAGAGFSFADHGWDGYFDQTIAEYEEAKTLGGPINTLVGLDYAHDRNGDRVNRLVFQGRGADELNGQMVDGEYVKGRYALCAGEGGETVVCERSTRTKKVYVGGAYGMGQYVEVEEEVYVPTGQSVDQFMNEVADKYGADSFNVHKPGMNTDINSAENAVREAQDGTTPGYRPEDGTISVGVENTSGTNVQGQVSKHLAGVDSGQGRMLADLVGALDNHNMMGIMTAHSDGTSVTAIADAILNNRAGNADAMTNDNTFLYGSPLENSFLKGAADKVWGPWFRDKFTSPLNNRYTHKYDPVPNSPQDGSWLKMDYHGFESVYLPVHKEYVVGQGLRGQHTIHGDLNEEGTAYINGPTTQPRDEYMADYEKRQEEIRRRIREAQIEAMRYRGMGF